MSDEKKSYFRREQVEGFTQKSKTGKTFTRNYPALSDVSLENIRLGGRKRVLPLEEFIKVSKQKHGDKFDYSLVEYETISQKVKIICPVCGVFEQSADSHMQGRGCARCSGVGRLNTDEVIRRFRETYGDKYDYSKVVYESQNKKVIVICPIHGEFLANPKWHWSGKGGCPECRKDKIRKSHLGVRRVAADLNQIRDLRERGYTIQQIQDELGISRGTVQRRLKDIES